MKRVDTTTIIKDEETKEGEEKTGIEKWRMAKGERVTRLRQQEVRVRKRKKRGKGSENGLNEEERKLRLWRRRARMQRQERKRAAAMEGRRGRRRGRGWGVTAVWLLTVTGTLQKCLAPEFLFSISLPFP